MFWFLALCSLLFLPMLLDAINLVSHNFQMLYPLFNVLFDLVFEPLSLGDLQGL